MSDAVSHSQNGDRSGQTTSLTRQLGLWSAVFMCMGSEIGSGIFLVSADIATAMKSPMAGLMVWVVAGLISLAGALIFAELGTMFPSAGGEYVFLREAYHPILAFLYGWTLIFVIQAGTIAGLAAAFSRFMLPFLHLGRFGREIESTIIVVVLTLMNFVGIKRGAQLLDAVTSFKVVAIVGLILYVLFASPHGTVSPIDFSFGKSTLSAFGVALLAAFWAYDGWYSITFIAGEMKNPARDIPLSSLIAIIGTGTLYILCSYVYYKVLPVSAIAHSHYVAADAVRVLGGDTAVRILGIVVLISVLGCLNACIISGARVIYAMAKDNVLPHALAVVNPKTHSPNRALTLQMIWSILLVWSGTYDQLFTYVIVAGFIFYGLTASAVLWLRRKRPNQNRPYKVPLYPILPLAYVLFTIVFTVNSFVEKTKESFAGLLIVATGLPAYYIMKKLAARRAEQNAATPS